MRLSALLAASTFLAIASPSIAQTGSGTPAFRVPLGDATTATSGPAAYAWMQSVGTCSNACGDGTRTTSYQCQDVSSYDFSGSGYGAPEADSFCSATSAKPASSTTSCTNYSGCSYDWVKPAVTVARIAKPGNPAGGNFPVGAVDSCSYAKRVFAPYCQRSGSPSVTMASGDHAFCKNDTPDYNDVAAGTADALGYDRTGDESGGCVAGSRDHEWKFDRIGTPAASTCSAAPVRTNVFQCVQKYNGASKADSFCAGVPVPSPGVTETRPADYSGCTTAWETGSWGAYSSSCSSSATRTRTVVCRRSDGTAVADSQCTGAKPATSETSSNYVGCGYDWSTPTAWTYASGCSASTTRTRSTSCTRSDGTVVADSYCSAGSRPSTSESGVANYDSCTYSPRDMGRTTCSAQGRQDQYWDCTRSDGTTGYPASYCGKTNPESVACTPPPPVYTYTPVNRGETACSNGQKQVYWDCTRNDGATGFPASNCGKTNPETQSCLSYTPRNRGESACSNSQKQVYWDCLGSDGNAYPASNCGKTNPETQSCTMPYTWAWQAGGWSAASGGCPGSSTRTRSVSCVRSDGYVDSDQYCNAATRPASTETTACQYTWSWATGGWSAYNSGCSASATRTRSVVCQRNDGYADSDQFCDAGSRPASSETTANYSGCGYTTEDTSSSNCVNGTRTYTTQCRRSDGNLVANSNCGNNGSRTESCSVTPPSCAASVDSIAVNYGSTTVTASRQTHVEYYNVAGGSQQRAQNPGAYGYFTLTNNGETRSFNFNYRLVGFGAGGQSYFTGVVGGYTYKFRVGIVDSSYRLALADVICE